MTDAKRRERYGHDIDKDRCAVCGGVIVLVDGPVRRWDKWWTAGDWVHRQRPAATHLAVPGRTLSD